MSVRDPEFEFEGFRSVLPAGNVGFPGFFLILRGAGLPKKNMTIWVEYPSKIILCMFFI